MKLKSLLFGSAAALMAATGAQAAEPLEPIAEPIDYVRICDVFGTGFFYIPGTDTCLRIGGYVRADYVYNHDWRDVHVRATEVSRVDGRERGFVTSPVIVLPDGRTIIPAHTRSERDHHNFGTRARARLTMDSRTQTRIGMVRTFYDLWFTLGPQNTRAPAGQTIGDTSTAVSTRQAFIQIANDWGTLTFGRADSFFEFWESDAWATRLGEDAPLSPVNLAAATFNLGGGVSATLALEDSITDGDRRRHDGHTFRPADLNQDGIADVIVTGGGFPGHAGIAGFGNISGIHGGNRVPDIVGNIRVDQAWGSAQVMALAHQIRAHSLTGPDFAPDAEPSNEWGWAVGAGVGIDIPGTGITFNIQGVYSDGAPGTATTGGAGFMPDGVVVGVFNPLNQFGTCVPTAAHPNPCGLVGTSIETTEAWSVKAGINGNLAPDWIFNLQGSFARVNTPDVLGGPVGVDADGRVVFAAGPTAIQTGVFVPATNGDPAFVRAGPVLTSDYDFWTVSGNVAWAPIRGFIAGVELGYEKMDFDTGGDIDRWGGMVRVQKTF